MISLMSNILMCSAACLLVLPVGWCCAPSTEVAEVAVESCPACASHGKSSPDSEPLHGTGGKCQCRDVLTTPVVVAKVDLPAVSALPVALVDLPAAPLAQLAVADSRIIDPGPPLRVLQCVMHC